MNLLVKQIDVFKSVKHKGKIVAEYIIYVMIGNTPIKAYVEIGNEAKDKRILSLLNNIND